MLVVCGVYNDQNIAQEYRLVKDESKDLVQRTVKLGNTGLTALNLIYTLSGKGGIAAGTNQGYVRIYPDMISPIHMDQILAHCKFQTI